MSKIRLRAINFSPTNVPQWLEAYCPPRSRRLQNATISRISYHPRAGFQTSTTLDNNNDSLSAESSLQKPADICQSSTAADYVPHHQHCQFLANPRADDTIRSAYCFHRPSRLTSINSLRRERDYGRLAKRLPEPWQNALGSITALFLHSPGVKSLEDRLKVHNILHYTPNYGLAHPRLRRRILRKVWFSLNKSNKQTFIQSTLLHALNDYPALAFDVLQDSIKSGLSVSKPMLQNTLARASAAVIADSVQNASFHPKTVELLCTKLSQTMHTLASYTPHLITHSLILTFCKPLSRLMFKKFLQSLPSELDKLFSTRTICHLIKMAASRGLVEISISLLRHIHETQEGNFLVQWACVDLVRIQLATQREYLHRLRLHIIQEILRIGIIPDDPLRNAIIQTFMEGDDADTAWTIFRKTVDRGLLPTRGTFFALLQRCPDHKLNDIFKIAHLARSHSCLDASVGYRLLDAMRQFQMHEKSLVWPFNSALRLYIQIFDAKPLVDLGFIDNDTCLMITPKDSQRLRPQAKTLHLMIRAFCTQFTGSPQIWHSYQEFIKSVLSGNRLFGRAALKPWAFEYFMAGMNREPDLVGACAQILQDMLVQQTDDDLSSATTENTDVEERVEKTTSESGEEPVPLSREAHPQGRQIGNKIQIARPRSTTWNLLLSSLVNARKLDAAEELVEMMQEEGFQPTLCTWNTLIDGFSNAQDSRKVALAVEQMENQEFEADDRTYRALTRIFDRAALFSELDKALRRRTDALKRSAHGAALAKHQSIV